MDVIGLWNDEACVSGADPILMMKSAFLIHGAWLLVAVGTFALGRMGQSADAGSGEASRIREGESRQRAVTDPGARAKENRVGGRSGGAKTAEAMRLLVEQHHAETDSMQKRRAFFEILDAMTPENAEATVLAWKEARGPLESWAAVETIAEFIAEQDPKTAAGWVAQYAGSESGKQAILGVAKELAGTNPRGAARWAEGLPAGENRVLAIQTVVKHMAHRWPGVAADYMEKLEPGPNRDTSVAAYAGIVMSKDPESGLAWIQSIDAAELRNETMVTQGRLWVRKDPDAAGAWLETADLPESVVERIRAE